MAVCYGFGGVTIQAVVAGFAALVLGAMQIGAIGLMLSCYCRSTTAALLMTYVVAGALYVSPAVVFGLLLAFQGMLYRVDDRWLYLLAPTSISTSAMQGQNPWPFAAGVMMSTVAMLLLARWFFVRRAFVKPRNLMLAFFRKLDAFFKSANAVTGNVELWSSKDTLPGDQPVAWWEVTKRSLGKAHYLFRVLILLQLPALFVAAAMVVNAKPGRGQNDVLTVMLGFIWCVSILMLTAQAASTFSVDRSRQRLDVLLTTAMSDRQIVLEKTAALKRLTLVLLMPLATVAGAEAWWEYMPSVTRFHFSEGGSQYIVATLLSFAVYPAVAAWMGMWLGMRTVKHVRAIMWAIGLLLTVCLLPMWLSQLARSWFGLSPHSDLAAALASAISPLTMFDWTETNQLKAMAVSPWILIVFHYTIWAGVALLLRRQCIVHASRYLGRVAANASVAASPPTDPSAEAAHI